MSVDFLGAKWIWTQAVTGVNRYADFLVDFEANEYAVLRIAAANDYITYLNGAYVGSGAYPSYKEKKYYDEIVLPVEKGKNRLAIVGYVANAVFNTCVKDDRGICFEIVSDRGRWISDERVLCRESKRFISGETVKLTVGYSVVADLNADDVWMKTQADAVGFAPAFCVEDTVGLQKRPIAKLSHKEKKFGRICAQGVFAYAEGKDVSERMQNAYLSAKKLYAITENFPCAPLVFRAEKGARDDGVYLVIDLGEESTGYFTVDIETETSLKIDYSWGEHLGDLRVSSEIGTKYCGSFWTAAGGNEYTEYFRRIGLRYLMLYIHGFAFTFRGAGIVPCYYPVKKKTYRADGIFEKKLHETGIRTLQCCMHEHYEDCPWREQSQYTMDMRNQLLAGYYVFDNPEFARASIFLAADKPLPEGGLPMTQPCDSEVFIPNFSLVYAVIVDEYAQYTGDCSALPCLLLKIEKILEYYESKLENGLLKNDFGKNAWNFFEWASGLSNPYWAQSRCETYSFAFPNQAFLIMAEEAFLNCLKRLGQTDERRKNLLGLLRRSAERFYDEKDGVYHTYLADGKTWHKCEYTQALAVCAKVAGGKRKESLCSLLAAKENGLVKLTLSDYLYKYEALMASSSDYKQHIKKEMEVVWGNMLFDGATAFYEVEEGRYAFGGAGSLCHGWSAIPVYFYQKYQL